MEVLEGNSREENADYTEWHRFLRDIEYNESIVRDHIKRNCLNLAERFCNICLEEYNYEELRKNSNVLDCLIHVLGDVHMAQERYQDAYDRYEEMQCGEDDPVILPKRGIALCRLGEYKKACSLSVDGYLMSYVSIADKNDIPGSDTLTNLESSFYLAIGLHFYLSLQYDKAIEWLEKSLILTPDCPMANFLMANQLKGKHNLYDAIFFYKKASELSSSMIGEISRRRFESL